MLQSIHERETRIVKTPNRCPSCAKRLPPDASFCGMCGHRRHGRAGLVGSVLDEVYRIEQLISESGFAAIYRATYVPTGQPVAIKVLHAELAADPRIRARFRRERRCLARLRSTTTVRMLDAGETERGLPYLVMELLCGTSLYDRLASGPLAWREALEILRAVCGALSEAHAYDIVHRDLKPANIYLDRSGVKLIDFGIASIHNDSQDQDLTHAGQTVGTRGYMSPEQLAGAPCDARSDIFSLGVVAYELLLGRRPFASHSAAEATISAMLLEVPRPPSAHDHELPREIDELVMRCLAPDPRNRFATVEQLATEIERLLQPQLVLRGTLPAFTDELVLGSLPAFLRGPAATELLDVSRPVRRGRWVLAIGGFAAAAVVVALLAL
jgi:eukaryotic-like serine/threonine-protein kinase